MKVISVSQPFATLIVKGFKVFETRSWAAPAAIIGRELGIASTKTVKAEAWAHAADPVFKDNYERTGLPPIEELVCGHLLGTVIVDAYELMTEEFMEDVSDEEQSYGWWNVGFYGWRLRQPRELLIPIAIRGAQGIYEWNGVLPSEEEEREAARAGRPANLWRNLRLV